MIVDILHAFALFSPIEAAAGPLRATQTLPTTILEDRGCSRLWK